MGVATQPLGLYRNVRQPPGHFESWAFPLDPRDKAYSDIVDKLTITDLSTLGGAGAANPEYVSNAFPVVRLAASSSINNFLSTPRIAAMGITNLDVRFKLLHRAVNTKYIASRWTATGNQRCWYVDQTATGALRLAFSTNGTASETKSSGAGMVVVDTWQVFRVTKDATSGDVKFYSSGDEGETWDIDSTVAGTASAPFDSTSVALVLGKLSNGGNFDGELAWFQMLDDIDGNVIVDYYAGMETRDDAATWQDTLGNTWTHTFDGSASAVANTDGVFNPSGLFFDGDDIANLASPPALTLGTDPYTEYIVCRINGHATNGTIFEARNATGALQGWTLGFSTTTMNMLATVQDDSANTASTSATAVILDRLMVLALVIDDTNIRHWDSSAGFSAGVALPSSNACTPTNHRLLGAIAGSKFVSGSVYEHGYVTRALNHTELLSIARKWNATI